MDHEHLRHLILITGCDEDEDGIRSIYFHDSDDRNMSGEGQKVDIEEFKKYFRKLAIFLEK